MDPAVALKRARLRAGLTQHALAARAGTSQATISAYESGRKRPSLTTLDRLLAATGASLAVVAGPQRGRDAAAADLARVDRSLQDVLGLAAALPVRHRPTLDYPRLVTRKRRSR